MKREARLLLYKSIDSLIISVDHFNSSHDAGRTTAVLLMLHHAFEMLLKASLVNRGAEIKTKGKGEGETIGFVDCVNKARSEVGLKSLGDQQDATLLEINSLRNSEQHFLIDVPEQKLYLTVQVGFTIFKEILGEVFELDLSERLPSRVLPVSTLPVVHIHTYYQDQVDALRQMLMPGKRRRAQFDARSRSLLTFEKSLLGDPQIPSDKEINLLAKDIQRGRSWHEVFPSVASIQIDSEGAGPTLALRITKKDGIPVHLVSDDSPHDGIVYTRNDSDFYSMNVTQLCKKLDSGLNISLPKCSAIVWHLEIQSDKECFKPFRHGKSTYNMYSQKALTRIRDALPGLDLDHVWERYKNRNR